MKRIKEKKTIIKLPVLTVAGDDSQLVGPGHGHVGVPQHHHCIQTLGQGELHGDRRTVRVL